MIAVARERRQTRPVTRNRTTSIRFGWGAGGSLAEVGWGTVRERRVGIRMVEEASELTLGVSTSWERRW